MHAFPHHPTLVGDFLVLISMEMQGHTRPLPNCIAEICFPAVQQRLHTIVFISVST